MLLIFEKAHNKITPKNHQIALNTCLMKCCGVHHSKYNKMSMFTRPKLNKFTEYIYE